MTRFLARTVCGLFAVAISSAGDARFRDQRVLVKTKKPYNTVKQQITGLGGSVTYEFTNADGLAVTIPDSQLNALKAVDGIEYVVEDRLVPNPAPKGIRNVTEALQADPSLDVAPANYFPYASVLTNARTLQLAGILGQGVVVGVIDAGTSRTASALCSNATNATTCAATYRRRVSCRAAEPNATSSERPARHEMAATARSISRQLFARQCGTIVRSRVVRFAPSHRRSRSSGRRRSSRTESAPASGGAPESRSSRRWIARFS